MAESNGTDRTTDRPQERGILTVVPAQPPVHDHRWELVTQAHAEIGLAMGRYRCLQCRAVWAL